MDTLLPQSPDAFIEGWAHYSFDSFRIQQPHIETGGLWKYGNRYLIHCPGYTAASVCRDGKPLGQWFDYSCRVASCPINLTPNVPLGSIRLRERTPVEIAQLAGEPTPLGIFSYDLNLHVPSTFPDFFVTDSPQRGTVIIHVSRPLSGEESAYLHQFMEMKGGLFEIVHEPAEQIAAHLQRQMESERKDADRTRQSDLKLIPVRALPKRLPRGLKVAYERDQDFWLDYRHRIWCDPNFSADDALPALWKDNSSKGLVDASAFPVSNIRNYLSLYDVVCIAPPLAYPFTKSESLGIDEDELIGLMSMGKVRLVIPHSLERYFPSFLERAAGVAPDSILFSRRLAVASMCDVRRRIPLLYPALDIENKRALIRLLDAFSASTQVIELKNFWNAFGTSLIESWRNAQYMIHLRGAMGMLPSGLGNILAGIYQIMKREDIRLEFWTCGAPVEWAGAISATLNVPPVAPDGYDQGPIMELIANSYSGIVSDPIPLLDHRANFVAEEILTIADSKVPVLEFAKSFNSGDINRFRSFVRQVSAGTGALEELEDVVNRFNAEVVAYEGRKELWSTYGIKGLVYNGAKILIAQTLGDPAGMKTKLFISWLIEMADRHFGKTQVDVQSVDGLLDYVKAIMNLTSRDAVLVSRMRRGKK